MSVQRPGVFNSFQLQTAPPFVRLMAKEVTCEYRIICTKIETKGGKRRMVLEGHSLRGLFSPPLTYEEKGKRKGGNEGRNEWINQLERRHYDVSDWAETGGYFVDMMFPSKVQRPLIEWHFVSLVSDHKRRTRGIASKKRNMTWHPPLKEKPNLKSPWKKNQSPLLHQHHLKSSRNMKILTHKNKYSTDVSIHYSTHNQIVRNTDIRTALQSIYSHSFHPSATSY